MRDRIILSELMKTEVWHDLFHGKFIFVGKTVFGGEMLGGITKDGSVGEKITIS